MDLRDDRRHGAGCCWFIGLVTVAYWTFHVIRALIGG